jgi:hypothetical protein
MITYDPNTETVSFTMKLPKSFIEGVISIYQDDSGSVIENAIVSRLKQELEDFSISKEELDGK